LVAALKFVDGQPSALFTATPFFCSALEAQAAATIAGHRLHRVLGGLNGRLRLDGAYSAYFTRLNEVAVVATFPASSVDGSADAPRAAEAARAAMLDAFNGKLSEVTLYNINRVGAVLQMTLRRAVQGFGVVHAIGSSKFDFSTIQISPDQPADDSSSLAVRAANDITAAGHLQAASDALNNRFGKADQLSESLRGLKVPVESAGRAVAKAEGTFPTTAGSDVNLRKKKKAIDGTAIPPYSGPSYTQYGGGSGALLGLLPAPPKSGVGGFLPDYFLAFGEQEVDQEALQRRQQQEEKLKREAEEKAKAAAKLASLSTMSRKGPGWPVLPSSITPVSSAATAAAAGAGAGAGSSNKAPPPLQAVVTLTNGHQTAASPKGGRSPKSIGSGMHGGQKRSHFDLDNAVSSSSSGDEGEGDTTDEEDDDDENDGGFGSFGFGSSAAGKKRKNKASAAGNAWPSQQAGGSSNNTAGKGDEFSSRPWAPAEDEADDSDINFFASAAANAVSASPSSASAAGGAEDISFDAFGGTAAVSDSESSEGGEEGEEEEATTDEDDDEEDAFGFHKVGRGGGASKAKKATTSAAAAAAIVSTTSTTATAAAPPPSGAAFDDIFGTGASSSSKAAAPAAPSAVSSAASSSFDDVFGGLTSTAASSTTTAGKPSQPPSSTTAASFDDVFGTTTVAKPATAATTTSSLSLLSSFDDPFGGLSGGSSIPASTTTTTKAVAAAKDEEDIFGFGSSASSSPAAAPVVAPSQPVVVDVTLPIKLAYQLTETITVVGRSHVGGGGATSSTTTASASASGALTPGSTASGLSLGSFAPHHGPTTGGIDSPRSVGSAGGWSTGSAGTGLTGNITPLSGSGFLLNTSVGGNGSSVGAPSPRLSSTPVSPSSPASTAAPSSSVADQTIIKGVIAIKMMFNGQPSEKIENLLPKELLGLASSASSSNSSRDLPFNLSLKCGQALTYISVSFPGDSGVSSSRLLVGSSSSDTNAGGTPLARVLAAGQDLALPLTLPLGKALANKSSNNTPFDVAIITYCLAPHPPLVKLSATCRYTFLTPGSSTSAGGGARTPGSTSSGGGDGHSQSQSHQQQHKFTDALIKLLLHPAMPSTITGAQLLLQLPPPLVKEKLPPALQASVVASSPSGTTTPSSYSPLLAMFKPATAQLAAAKGQILWNLPTAAAAPGATGTATSTAAAATSTPAGAASSGLGSTPLGKPPTAPSTPSSGAGGGAAPASSDLQLAPGRTLELKARVGIDHGVTVTSQQAVTSPVVPLAAQLKFTLPSGALAPIALSGAIEGNTTTLSPDPNHSLRVKVQVLSIFPKYTSTFKGTYSV
jgi:hypothetical protein